MSLIKKDELLAIIKEDLKKSSEENSGRNIKSVITTINKNINQDDSWNVFKEKLMDLKNIPLTITTIKI